MRDRRGLIALLFLMIALLFTACVDKKKIDDFDKTQKEILAKLEAIEGKVNTVEGKVNSIEKDQKEMMKAFKPRRPTIDYNKVHNLPVGKSKVRGNANAPVTIVEFSDFQCPYCSRLQPTLEKVLKDFPNEARLVFKNFPLSFHKQAKNAARATHAAGEQGKYWEMHDITFKNFNKLTEDSFKEFAGKLGLDETKFMADYKSGKYDNQIQQDINLGRQAGVTGTPSLFINGKRMKGRSYDDFKNTIESYTKKK